MNDLTEVKLPDPPTSKIRGDETSILLESLHLLPLIYIVQAVP